MENDFNLFLINVDHNIIKDLINFNCFNIIISTINYGIKEVIKEKIVITLKLSYILLLYIPIRYGFEDDFVCFVALSKFIKCLRAN